MDATPSIPPDASASTAEEDAFFERGLLEEQATLESISRRGPGAGRRRRRGASAFAGGLAIGLAALALFFSLRARSKRPFVDPPRRALAAPVEPAAPSPSAIIAPAPTSPAVPAEPDPGTVALLRANAELERGHSASAARWARRAVELDTGLAEAYVIIGSVEQQAGRRVAAREAYARYLALAPTGRYAAELRAISARR